MGLRFVALLAVTAATCLALLRGQPVDTSTASAQGEVHYVPRWDLQNSGVDDDLRAVQFVDSLTGWAVGSNNTILRTRDGGQSWQRLVDRRPNGPEFTDVQFTSATDGWVGARGTLLHTTNGGDSWQPANELARGVSGFGSGSSVGSTRFQTSLVHVYRSDDGGRTWTALPGQLAHNDYEVTFFTDSSHGWLARRGRGGLALTVDGGTTWQEVQQNLYCCGRSKIQFVNPSTGWTFGQDAATILSTADGGQTWTGQFTGVRASSSLQDMVFLNEVVGYVLINSDSGIVVMTADGGATWQEIGRLGASSNVRGISFPDSEHGWVVGDKGFVIHYHLVPVYDEEESAPSDEGGE
ncbi:MAG TPA: YCF48-related protein [Chloroflexota bacterium]|nr:YCF48-related protein [Chloroflexota bacterium]